MAEFDFSSYPKPQQQSNNPLDAVTKVGQVMKTLGDLERGKAVQGAITPEGDIDRNALAQVLKRTVAGSMQAIPTLDAVEKLKQAGHLADQAGLDNFQKRMAVVNHLFSQLAAKDNPTIADVNSIAARVLDPAIEGHKYGLTWPVVMNALKNFRGPDGRPLSAQEIKKRALDMQLMTAETSEQLGALSPRYQIQDDGNTIRFVPVGPPINPRYPNITKRIPTGSEITDTNPASPTYGQKIMVPPQPVAPEDQPSRVPIPRPAPMTREQMGHTVPTPENALPATFAERFNPRLGNALPASLPPGAAEAAVDTAKSGAALGNQLIAAANEVPAVKGILDNMERSLKQFTSGPGADWKRFATGLGVANLPESWQKEGGLLDPRKVASQEEFNKLAYQLAQRQFQQLGGTGTDSKLSSAMSTSPNEMITKLGNEGIMQMLKGNNDAIATQAREWTKFKNKFGANKYAEFIDQFNQEFNPRVFQFKYVPKKERQHWFDAMAPDEQKEFTRAAKIAVERGWLKARDLR